MSSKKTTWLDFKNTILKTSLENAWFFWSMVFFFLLLLAVVLSLAFHFSYDKENARYLISALIQSQAAIISIVITLTLVAIQITASQYTPRLVDTLKESPLMWLLLLFYLVSITLNIILLNYLPCYVFLDGILSYFYSFCIFNSILLFFSLLLYMRAMMSLLKVDNLLAILSKKLSPNICAVNSNLASVQNEIFNTYFDILNSAILKYDLPTVRMGLSIIGKRFIDITERFRWNQILSTLDLQQYPNPRTYFTYIFCQKIEHMAIIAGNSNNQDALRETINELHIILLQIFDWYEHQDDFPEIFRIILNTMFKFYKISVEHSIPAVNVDLEERMKRIVALISEREDLKKILDDVIMQQ